MSPTPRTRGSTPPSARLPSCAFAYPAYAGIDLQPKLQRLRAFRLPRVRGDRPKSLCAAPTLALPTPRTRGSTRGHGVPRPDRPAYPAYAGIDLRSKSPPARRMGLPRVRGDRPQPAVAMALGITPTPRTRGSTSMSKPNASADTAYPAYAGIDPGQSTLSTSIVGLPRVRGDRPGVVVGGGRC